MNGEELLEAIGIRHGPLPYGVIRVIVRPTKLRPGFPMDVSLDLTNGRVPAVGDTFVVHRFGALHTLLAFAWADSSTLIALHAEGNMPPIEAA
jgi:hypothetical protein